MQILTSENFKDQEIEGFKDMRELVSFKFLKQTKLQFTCTFPFIKSLQNKTFRSGKYRLDLFNPKCDCREFTDNSVLYNEARDIRRFCKHIQSKVFLLVENGSIILPSLVLCILTNQKEHGSEILIKVMAGNEEFFVLGYPEDKISDWINVYANADGDNNKYFKYGFNYKEKRWKRNLLPPNKEIIEGKILEITGR